MAGQDDIQIGQIDYVHDFHLPTRNNSAQEGCPAPVPSGDEKGKGRPVGAGMRGQEPVAVVSRINSQSAPP